MKVRTSTCDGSWARKTYEDATALQVPFYEVRRGTRREESDVLQGRDRPTVRSLVEVRLSKGEDEGVDLGSSWRDESLRKNEVAVVNSTFQEQEEQIFKRTHSVEDPALSSLLKLNPLEELDLSVSLSDGKQTAGAVRRLAAGRGRARGLMGRRRRQGRERDGRDRGGCVVDEPDVVKWDRHGW